MKTLRLNNKTNKYNAEEMINEFLLLQQQKGVVKTTLRSHLYALQDLHKECTDIPTEQDIRRCLPPNISNAYYNKRLSTYRQYYDMLIDFGHILNNPTMKWGYKKISFNIKNYEECNVKKFLSCRVSVARGGKLTRNVEPDELRKILIELQKKGSDEKKRKKRKKRKNEQESTR